MTEKQSISQKILPKVTKFTNMKSMVALRDGMMYIIPITLIGSVFLLMAQLPFPAVDAWITEMLGDSWKEPLWQVVGATFDIIALVAVFTIAYTYVKNEGFDPIPGALVSLMSFLIVNAAWVTTESGEIIGGVIDKQWTGGKGMITAIIVSLSVSKIYTWLMKKGITIKLPDTVPPGISSQFAALIPGFIIITGAAGVFTFFKFVLDTTLVEWIYKVLQTPLQSMTDSLAGAIAIGFLISFFWWFGIHGPNVVMAVMGSLVTANALANQAIIDSGAELSVSSGAHIVTSQFVDQYLTFTGSGITIGLVLAMLFAAKSEQSKALGKLSIVPAIFNINEPVLFGFPIVLNPYMFLPFVLVPTISAVMTYAAIATGFLEPFTGVMVPWTTPPIISGLIVGGIRGAIWQVVVIAMSTLVYYPFFKRQDNIYYMNEQEKASKQKS